MIRAAAAMMLILALWAPASLARAGVYTDDLAKCLVRSASDSDQEALVIWVFAAMGSHPSVQAYSSMTEVQRDAATKTAAQLMQRLVTVDCRTASIDALKYEGPSTLEAAFKVLGEVAMRGLMGNPKVAAGMARLGDHVDSASIEALFKDAGIDLGAGKAK
ncbi:hypothetical protein [Phenylobacterium sp.]|uniref:hypothetical protein n=1 Tax=Phenylobacterium sp. TaxID=1871053 RepID=UPI00286ACD58|nr:hypothetical protein [Phenylobacterium sp.]